MTDTTELETRDPAHAAPSEIRLPTQQKRGLSASIVLGLVIAALGLGFALGCLFTAAG